MGINVVDRFFFCVILPDGDQQMVSGQMTSESAETALRVLESIHPDALELHIRKQKANASQAITERKPERQRVI